MKIGNYMNFIKDNRSDPSERRLDRLEKRRDRWDQTFDRMQQQAIKDGDSEKAQQIFEMSEMMEEKLDTRLDKLEEKTGSFSWDRHLDNAFDELQAKAYEGDDPEMAESIFGLSQVVKGGKFDSSKQLLLQKLLSDSDAKPSMIAALSSGSDETGWASYLKASTQKTAATETTASNTSTTAGTTANTATGGVKTS